MCSIPNAELHVFPNSGHWAMIEQQEAFENVVLSFLLRSDPREHLSGAAASVVGTAVKYVMACELKLTGEADE
jgi:hypothetical protein